MIVLTTLLLVLDIIHIKMVDATEKGLWDFLPGFLIAGVFIAYPVLLVASYILFLFGRRVKTKYDLIPNILFPLNGLIVAILLVIYLGEEVKNL